VPEFRDTVHTKAFRAMFERLPPYTLQNMQASRAAERARDKAEFDAGFAARTEMGTPPQILFHQNPALSGIPKTPESGAGRVINAEA